MQPTVVRKTAGQGFSALTNYVTVNVAAGDLRVSNCMATDVSGCVSEVTSIEGQQPAAMHLILSYQPGRMPSNEQIFADEEAACDQFSVSKHPRISAIHREADSVHVHVAIATSITAYRGELGNR